MLISLRFQLICQSFLSAFLLFLIQPIFATQWTPFFGGSASVWSICLLAFQCLLMLGYAIALTRISQKIHIFCLLLAWLWYVFVSFFQLEQFCLSPHLLQSPSIALLIIFFWHIGPLYLILSLTSPYLQKYYFHQIQQPEKLFAYSNLGSLLALILFPILIALGLPTIKFIYHLLLISLIALFLTNLRMKNILPSDEQLNPYVEKIVNITPTKQIAILFFSALGSALLVASSQTVSQDIGSHPFLWTLFLASYLISHILTFAWPQFTPPTPLLIFALFGLISILKLSYHASLYLQTLGIALCFTFICWHIHSTMLSFMPSTQKKTFAYLLMSIGGAIGGLIAGPLSFSFFHAPYELHFFLMIWACTLLLLKGFQFQRNLALVDDPLLIHQKHKWRLFQLLLICSIIPQLFQLFQLIQKFNQYDAISYRNFYGYLQIREIAKKNQPRMIHLLDGRISHGFQYIGEFAQEPTTYFVRNSGVGLTFEFIRSLHAQTPPIQIITSKSTQSINVSILGLGIGTLSAYAQKNDHFQFFEINPDVILSAYQHFSFLADAQKRYAKIEVWEGDGRQMIQQKIEDDSQDLLILDAFSGDAPPPHLITWQAMEMYFQKVHADGLIAMNVSNLHLNLRGVVVGHMKRLGLFGKWIRARTDSPLGIYLSDWVILCRERGKLEGIEGGEWIGGKGERGVDWGDEGGAIWGF